MTYTRMTYCGNLVYENDTLKQVLIDGGYVTFNGSSPQYHFYVQDHLGNNRVVCNASGTIEQVNHYYPFGGLMGESTNDEVQRYKYNGKELDRMHGLNLYDYGARQYDATLGKFTTMDPLCEKYYNMSPYAYCAANPVRFVDIDGREMGLPEELLFAVKHPFITSRIGVGVTKGAINISTNATRFATRGNILYGSNPKAGQDDRGSENGAFRHALWQAEITSEFGSNIAKQVGDAHEDNPNIDMNKTVFSSIDEADKSVDLHNNIIGRIIGDKNKGAGMRDIAVAVLNAFKEDGLYVANKVKGEYVLEKVKINSDKHKQLLNIFNKLDNNGRFDYEKPQIEDDEIRRYEALQNALP